MNEEDHLIEASPNTKAFYRIPRAVPSLLLKSNSLLLIRWLFYE